MFLYFTRWEVQTLKAHHKTLNYIIKQGTFHKRVFVVIVSPRSANTYCFVLKAKLGEETDHFLEKGVYLLSVIWFPTVTLRKLLVIITKYTTADTDTTTDKNTDKQGHKQRQKHKDKHKNKHRQNTKIDINTKYKYNHKQKQKHKCKNKVKIQTQTKVQTNRKTYKHNNKVQTQTQSTNTKVTMVTMYLCINKNTSSGMVNYTMY